MDVAVVPAFNEENNIGNLILKVKKFVDKVLVVDDGSLDDTVLIAEKAGAQVIKIEVNKGYFNALTTGFKKAIEQDADFIVVLAGDGSDDPENIPKLFEPLKKGNTDISMVDPGSGFRAYTKKSLLVLVKEFDKKQVEKYFTNTDLLKEKIRTKKLSNIISRYTPLNIFENDLIFEVKKLTTPFEIHNKKREIQKRLAKKESYRLICETFLKFIPPAVLSFLITIGIIIPLTNVININLEKFWLITLFLLIIFIIFFISWRLLIRFINNIYEDETFIEALDKQLEAIEEKIKKQTKKHKF